MYYKITNKDCEVYQKLHAMRTEELQWEKENRKYIEELIGLEWSAFMGYNGQQNWHRVTIYKGFVFDDVEKVDLKVWQPSKDKQQGFVPNRRTKAGREMAAALGKIKGRWFDVPLTILGIPHPNGKFKFPFVEIAGDVIVLFLFDGHIPSDENVIEITYKEFNQIRTAQ